jgi:hypothetical protein
MNQLIYVETSIPSFYSETRPGAQIQARREWTREWWELAQWQDELVSSLWVIRELEETPKPKRSECLELMQGLRLLQSAPEIDEIVEHYIAHKVMPADADGDARHLAVATFWKCDILASWNCQPPRCCPAGCASHRLSRSARLQTHRQCQQFLMLSKRRDTTNCHQLPHQANP